VLTVAGPAHYHEFSNAEPEINHVLVVTAWGRQALLFFPLLLVHGALFAGVDDSCTTLLAGNYLGLPDAPTTLTAAQMVEPTDDLPAHCLITGYIAPQVHFELRLPRDTWNRKFLMQGCGGLCGGVSGASCDDALARNYAVVATDMGHQAPSFQALWAYDNLQAEIDFAYRATHVVAVAAKTLIENYYDEAPRYSYFRGCSTGGRQGLVEAQRFPEDFDGIISGAPVLNETGTAALHLIWSGRANLDEQGNALLNPQQVTAAHDAMIDACDELDELADGIIEDPRQCDWRKIIDRRLSVSEQAVFEKLYEGPRNSSGRLLLPGGLMPGSEYEWVPYFVGKGGPAVFHPDGAIRQLYQYLIFLDDPGPGHSASEFDFDRDPQRLALMEVLYSALNPDLRRFKSAGGKLIIYQGWDDVEVTPMNTVDYFTTMQATMGGAAATADFARLFMMPGVAHCRRGPGADTVDWLTYLEHWVEDDRPPERIVAFHLATEQNYLGLPRPRFPLPDEDKAWARPLYSYPAVARYAGSGDQKKAENWMRHLPSPVAD